MRHKTLKRKKSSIKGKKTRRRKSLGTSKKSRKQLRGKQRRTSTKMRGGSGSPYNALSVSGASTNSPKANAAAAAAAAAAARSEANTALVEAQKKVQEAARATAIAKKDAAKVSVGNVVTGVSSGLSSGVGAVGNVVKEVGSGVGAVGSRIGQGISSGVSSGGEIIEKNKSALAKAGQFAATAGLVSTVGLAPTLAGVAGAGVGYMGAKGIQALGKGVNKAYQLSAKIKAIQILAKLGWRFKLPDGQDLDGPGAIKWIRENMKSTGGQASKIQTLPKAAVIVTPNETTPKKDDPTDSATVWGDDNTVWNEGSMAKDAEKRLFDEMFNDGRMKCPTNIDKWKPYCDEKI